LRLVGQRTQRCPTTTVPHAIYAFGGRVPLRVLGAIPSLREYRPLMGGEATRRLFSLRNGARFCCDLLIVFSFNG
jgi:hypothetical protein